MPKQVLTILKTHASRSQTVTERLTHNVSIAVDDGKSLRFEGYSSLPMPLHITGLETSVFLGAFSFLRVAF